MADYPSSIYSPRTMANRPGVEYDAEKTKVIFAEDFNLDRAEIVAIENTLGIDPQGEFTTVVDRLDDVDDRIDEFTETGGWKTLDTIPTRLSADDPTFVLRFAADMTAILAVGQRIKFTQDGTTRYFIVTLVGSYAGGNTDVTVYGGTDYDVADTGSYPITSPSYSREFAPFGFPLDRDKWTHKVTNSTNDIFLDDPSDTDWHFIDVGNDKIDLPVGGWQLSWCGTLKGIDRNSRDYISFQATLSTIDDAESDTDFSVFLENRAKYSTTYDLVIRATQVREKFIYVSSKTTYYLLLKSTFVMADGTIRFFGTQVPTIIKAVSAYV